MTSYVDAPLGHYNHVIYVLCSFNLKIVLVSVYNLLRKHMHKLTSYVTSYVNAPLGYIIT